MVKLDSNNEWNFALTFTKIQTDRKNYFFLETRGKSKLLKIPSPVRECCSLQNLTLCLKLSSYPQHHISNLRKKYRWARYLKCKLPSCSHGINLLQTLSVKKAEPLAPTIADQPRRKSWLSLISRSWFSTRFKQIKVRSPFLVEKWLVGDDHVVYNCESIIIKLYSGFTVTIQFRQFYPSGQVFWIFLPSGGVDYRERGVRQSRRASLGNRSPG